MISVNSYPKSERLNIISTENSGGLYKINISQIVANYNLIKGSTIFVNSEGIVGEYEITTEGTNHIIINLAYSTDTAGGYLLTNINIPKNSSWNDANSPIIYEFQRKDKLCTSDGDKIITIDNTSVLTNGQKIYLNAGGLNQYVTVANILNSTDIRINATMLNADSGFINYVSNYYCEFVVISQGETVTTILKPDAKGIIKFDVSEFVANLIIKNNEFHFNSISYRDDNVSNYYRVGYKEKSATS